MDRIIVLKNQKIAKKVKDGTPWIFANEIVDLPDWEAGSLVRLMDNKQNDFGLGFYNRNSLIAVRLLFTNEFNFELIKYRISAAIKLREKLIENPQFCRIVFGESDYLPGLIIDRYGDYYVIEILSAGFENLKELVLRAILEINPNTQGILQKNSSIWRVREGLKQQDEILFGEIPDLLIINENGIKYGLNLLKAQKTGYFYDQRLNRLFVQQISKKCKVLDLFCNQGGFGLNAAKGGASKVVGVDIQTEAIENAKHNSKLNGFGCIEFVQDDCFDYLKVNSEKFDIIISDPPAFTKSKKNVPEAIGAYYQINKLAIRNLGKNGILLTSSCSHHIYEEKFYEIVQKAAKDSNRNLRLIYRGMQSPDHPILDTLPATKYLKFFGFILD